MNFSHLKGGRIIFSRVCSSARHKRSLAKGCPTLVCIIGIIGSRASELEPELGAGATFQWKRAPELEPELLCDRRELRSCSRSSCIFVPAPKPWLKWPCKRVKLCRHPSYLIFSRFGVFVTSCLTLTMPTNFIFTETLRGDYFQVLSWKSTAAYDRASAYEEVAVSRRLELYGLGFFRVRIRSGSCKLESWSESGSWIYTVYQTRIRKNPVALIIYCIA